MVLVHYVISSFIRDTLLPASVNRRGDKSDYCRYRHTTKIDSYISHAYVGGKSSAAHLPTEFRHSQTLSIRGHLTKSRCLVEIHVDTDLLLVGDSRDVSAGDAAVANIVNAGLAGSSETELAVDTFNAVGGVDVFDKRELEAGGTSLTRSDSGVGQEILPDLEELVICDDSTVSRRWYSPCTISFHTWLPPSRGCRSSCGTSAR